jgi:hypothetical protein
MPIQNVKGPNTKKQIEVALQTPVKSRKLHQKSHEGQKKPKGQ